MLSCFQLGHRWQDQSMEATEWPVFTSIRKGAFERSNSCPLLQGFFADSFMLIRPNNSYPWSKVGKITKGVSGS